MCLPGARLVVEIVNDFMLAARLELARPCDRGILSLALSTASHVLAQISEGDQGRQLLMGVEV